MLYTCVKLYIYIFICSHILSSNAASYIQIFMTLNLYLVLLYINTLLNRKYVPHRRTQVQILTEGPKHVCLGMCIIRDGENFGHVPPKLDPFERPFFFFFATPHILLLTCRLLLNVKCAIMQLSLLLKVNYEGNKCHSWVPRTLDMGKKQTILYSRLMCRQYCRNCAAVRPNF